MQLYVAYYFLCEGSRRGPYTGTSYAVLENTREPINREEIEDLIGCVKRMHHLATEIVPLFWKEMPGTQRQDQDHD